MSKAKYDDFLTQNPNCSKFKGNVDAIAIFNLLNDDATIINTIATCQHNQPAFTACALPIEHLMDNKANPTIDLNDKFTRTVIGRMLKTILAPFGFEPTKQKDLPKTLGAKYFSSSSCYEQTGNATMHIVSRIEEIH
jgi:DNA-directed RNA polymerase subunit L